MLGEGFRMLLTLAEVQRIAAEVAAEKHPDLEVTVTSAQGESAYTELIRYSPAAQPSHVALCRSRPGYVRAAIPPGSRDASAPAPQRSS